MAPESESYDRQSPRGALVQFLTSAFNPNELKALISHMPNGQFLSPALPGEGTSVYVFTVALCHELERRGLMDDTFFQSLEEQRPRLKPQIEELRRMWAVPREREHSGNAIEFMDFESLLLSRELGATNLHLRMLCIALEKNAQKKTSVSLLLSVVVGLLAFGFLSGLFLLYISSIGVLTFAAGFSIALTLLAFASLELRQNRHEQHRRRIQVSAITLRDITQLLLGRYERYHDSSEEEL